MRTNADVLDRDDEVVHRCVSTFGGMVQRVDDCGTNKLFHNHRVNLGSSSTNKPPVRNVALVSTSSIESPFAVDTEYT